MQPKNETVNPADDQPADNQSGRKATDPNHDAAFQFLKARISESKPAIVNTSQEVPPVEVQATKMGELLMLDPHTVKIGERYRARLDKDDAMQHSITLYGQLDPILIRKRDNLLIHGYRRVVACCALGIQVLAHAIDIDDKLLVQVQIEGDRVTKGLTLYGKYLATEDLRPVLEDEAWTRKVLGTKVTKGDKGRVEDALARHVGLSRGSYRKLKAVMSAAIAEPDKYGDLKSGLEKDGKIDRYYKALIAKQSPSYSGREYKAITIAPTWGHLDDEEFTTLFGNFGLSAMLAEDGVVLVPTQIGKLTTALEAIRKSGLILKAAEPQAGTDSCWLFTSKSRKLDLSSDVISGLRLASRKGFAKITDSAKTLTEGHSMPLDVLSLTEGATSAA